jgi:parvulin-like peptidyl-prolyl isomerase
MRHYFWILRVLAAILLFIGTVGFVSDKDLPIMKGKKTVATVNNEPITLDEFNQELATIHQGIVGDQKTERERISGLLERLINTRLIIQEARRMGLDELKELKEREDVFARQTLRDELIDRHVKDIKPDEKEVEKIYKESVKEFKIRSILFEKEEDAKQMEGLVKAGMNFDETFKKFLSDKKGKGEEEGSYLKSKELLPEIEEAVSKMTIGSFSSVIKIKSGYVIFKLEDIRFPEDPGIREKIKLDILLRKQKEAYFEYFKALKKKYAKANERLLKGLDFESKEPGFEKLVKDKRVLVEIRGEKPITVGEFSEYMKQQLFHGIERAVEAKRLNKRKEQVLDDMLQKRILRKEAVRLGIDKTEGYKSKVKENENSLLFGAFVAKAVAPDIKLKEEELKTYYDQHIKEYTYPEMMKIKSLAFLKREDAEKAIVNLRKGTDFQWLKTNAEGQLDKDKKGALSFEGNLLTKRDLPENVQKAVSGAKSGDFRLLANPENYFYVLSIQEVIPPRAQPYPEAREQIAKKIYNEKLTKAVEDYADKLRALSEVKIYLKEN